MVNTQFVSLFIAECIGKSICVAKDMYEEAEKQIQICEEEINKADLARIRKDNLLLVLKNFEKQNKKEEKPKQINMIADKELMMKICIYIKSNLTEYNYEVKYGNYKASD